MSCGFFPPASDPSLTGDLVGDGLPTSATNPSLTGDKEARGNSLEAVAEGGDEGFIAREMSKVGATLWLLLASCCCGIHRQRKVEAVDAGLGQFKVGVL
jgi:hypothetical protein